MRNNEVRDSLAKIMHDVWYDVEVEPTLHLLQCVSSIHNTTSTDEIGRLDIKTNGLWRSKFSRYFCDVKINPLAKSRPKNSEETFKYLE